MSGVSLSEFADKLDQIMPVFMREFVRRHNSDLLKDKITMPQFFILNHLYKQGETNMSCLAKFIGVTTAAATGLVDRIVKSGYVERVYEPQDRRVIKIKLSAKGESLIKKIVQDRRQTTMDIFGKISQQDRDDYLRVLGRVYEILTKNSPLKK
ncbi:MAG: MarR family transcriptional regulator [Candidatus Omnitrophica bacterium]|nr:MarR family transcriptional regulator [Candidatus Omnitrophota bacterium]